MNDKVTFTDAELTAFLDGEHEHINAAQIELELSKQPALANRLKQLTFDRNAVSSTLDSLLAQAPEMPELNYASKNTQRSGIWKIVSAACLAFAIGFGVSNFTATPSQASWIDYVATYQALYGTSTLSHIEPDETTQLAELERANTAININLDLEKLNSLPSMEYKRAQILSFEGRELVQLTFLTDKGDPVALCIIRSLYASNKMNKFDYSEKEKMRSAFWQKGDFEYFLIGTNDEKLIKTVAEQFSSNS